MFEKCCWWNDLSWSDNQKQLEHCGLFGKYCNFFATAWLETFRGRSVEEWSMLAIFIHIDDYCFMSCSHIAYIWMHISHLTSLQIGQPFCSKRRFSIKRHGKPCSIKAPYVIWPFIWKIFLLLLFSTHSVDKSNTAQLHLTFHQDSPSQHNRSQPVPAVGFILSLCCRSLYELSRAHQHTNDPIQSKCVFLYNPRRCEIMAAYRFPWRHTEINL